METYIHALSVGFDFTFVIKEIITEVIGQELSGKELVDSKIVFDIITKEGNTTERITVLDVFKFWYVYFSSFASPCCCTIFKGLHDLQPITNILCSFYLHQEFNERISLPILYMSSFWFVSATPLYFICMYSTFNCLILCKKLTKFCFWFLHFKVQALNVS